jgi:hypothetical protein
VAAVSAVSALDAASRSILSDFADESAEFAVSALPALLAQPAARAGRPPGVCLIRARKPKSPGFTVMRLLLSRSQLADRVFSLLQVRKYYNLSIQQTSSSNNNNSTLTITHSLTP